MNSMTHILIIDDDDDARRSLKIILETMGYTVEMAGTGHAAIEMAQSRLFNLALMDIKLPDVEGIELIPALKAIQPDIAIIMVSGYSSEEIVVSALNAGASDYFIKPLNLNALMESINHALDVHHQVVEYHQTDE